MKNQFINLPLIVVVSSIFVIYLIEVVEARAREKVVEAEQSDQLRRLPNKPLPKFTKKIHRRNPEGEPSLPIPKVLEPEPKLEYDNKKTFYLAKGETREITGLTFLFDAPGTRYAVPNLILNPQTHNRSEWQKLPINGRIKILKQGELISIEKMNCAIQKVLTDVLEHHMIGCVIKIEKVVDQFREASTPSTGIMEKVVDGDQLGDEIFHPDGNRIMRGVKINDYPLVYLGIPEFFVQNNGYNVIGGIPRYSGGANYKFKWIVITEQEVLEVIFLPREILEGQKKKLDAGSHRLTITPELKSKKSKYISDNARIHHSDFKFRVLVEFNQDRVTSNRPSDLPFTIISYSFINNKGYKNLKAK